MNRAVACLLLALVSALRGNPPAGENWKPLLEFTDEFDGSALDLKKWQKGNPQWQGRQPGLFADQNVAVKGGRLLLTMRAENLPKMPEGYRDFTCASVASLNRVRYGWFEVRAKAMKSAGASAFWFYHNTPERWTEIDVYEICGRGKESGRMHTSAHVMHAPGITKAFQKPEPIVLAQDPAAAFHVYALEWNARQIKWHCDGKLVRVLENTHWTQPLHLLLDTETMPGWFGLPEKSELPATHEIDYVRAWQPRPE